MSEVRLRKLADDFYVTGQLSLDDVRKLAREGVRTIINNRPDEEEPGQPSSQEIERVCRELGLAYAHVPVKSGNIFPDHVEAMARALADHPGPWVAYCRSGARSCQLWALVEARSRPPVEIVEAAERAGYDLRPLWPRLELIHAAEREPVGAK